MIDNPIEEFLELMQTATEEQAKEWLVENLRRFDAEGREAILLGFTEEAKRKSEGTYGDSEEMTFEEFRKMANHFHPPQPEAPKPGHKPSSPTTDDANIEHTLRVGQTVITFRLDPKALEVKPEKHKKTLKQIEDILAQIFSKNPDQPHPVMLESWLAIKFISVRPVDSRSKTSKA